MRTPKPMVGPGVPPIPPSSPPLSPSMERVVEQYIFSLQVSLLHCIWTIRGSGGGGGGGNGTSSGGTRGHNHWWGHSSARPRGQGGPRLMGPRHTQG